MRAEIYQKNISELRMSATNRDINNKLGRKLLPIFEEKPIAWEAVRYLNRGPATEHLTCEGYLRGWYGRVADVQKQVVKEIAASFGIAL